jgi:hypothetical protein
MVNDLIGLRHETAAKFYPGCTTIDCFGLFIETRKRLGLHDYGDNFQWVYEEMEDKILPLRKIASRMRKIAKRTNTPKEGDFVLLPSKNTTMGIGVVIHGGILTITENGPSFWMPKTDNAKFWTPINPAVLN